VRSSGKGSDGGAKVGRKQDKAEQRKKYKESFRKVEHGHSGRPVRKIEETALVSLAHSTEEIQLTMDIIRQVLSQL
jgi:hypothetical protein